MAYSQYYNVIEIVIIIQLINSEYYVYVNAREYWLAISECLSHTNFTSRNRVHPETFRTFLCVQYRTHRCNKKNSSGCWNVVVSNDLIKFTQFTSFYQIIHNFKYFKKKSYVTGNILNWEVVRLLVMHTLTRDAVLSFNVRI